jgi:hypothetical protein
MPLSLYRRHRRDCKSGHAEDLFTSEYDERKKGWRRCECPIFVSGTLQGTYKRRNTGQWEWECAKPIAIGYEEVGTWVGQAVSLVAAVPVAGPASAARRITIEDAVKAYLQEFAEHAAVATQKKYRLLLKRLTAFSEHRGFIMIDQWGARRCSRVSLFVES